MTFFKHIPDSIQKIKLFFMTSCERVCGFRLSAQVCASSYCKSSVGTRPPASQRTAADQSLAAIPCEHMAKAECLALSCKHTHASEKPVMEHCPCCMALFNQDSQQNILLL